MGMKRLPSWSSSWSSRNVSSAQRAWRLLRLALLWARNGGLLKCRLANELRLIPKHLKALKHHHHHRHHHHRLSRHARYGERQLSFDETPVFHMRTSTNLLHVPSSLRIRIPCLKPEVVDFDFILEEDEDGDGDGDEGCWCGGRFLENGDDDDAGSYCYDQDVVVEGEYDEDGGEGCNYLNKTEAKGIDAKAEEFIDKFYRDIKLQRLDSYRQYTEMINRGAY